MIRRTVGWIRGALRFALMLWNAVSVIFVWVMLLMTGLLVLAAVVGGFAACVWMWRHDGPAEFGKTMLVFGVTLALLMRGLELLDRADSSKQQSWRDP